MLPTIHMKMEAEAEEQVKVLSNDLYKVLIQIRMEGEICLYSKYGFCKYKESCRKQNIKEVCDITKTCKNLKCCSKRLWITIANLEMIGYISILIIHNQKLATLSQSQKLK